jgi:uncharacterized protein with PIN domain
MAPRDLGDAPVPNGVSREEVHPAGITADRDLSSVSFLEAGMGHRAQLNFGDCAVCALAASRGEPVLATGNDFAATDLSC